MDDSAPKPAATPCVVLSNEEKDGEISVLPLTRSIGQAVFEIVSGAGQEGIIYKVNLFFFPDLTFKSSNVDHVINLICRISVEN